MGLESLWIHGNGFSVFLDIKEFNAFKYGIKLSLGDSSIDFIVSSIHKSSFKAHQWNSTHITQNKHILAFVGRTF